LFELKAAVAFRRRGVASKLVLPGRAEPYHSAKCDPTLIKAIARGRLWFEEPARSTGSRIFHVRNPWSRYMTDAFETHPCRLARIRILA